MQKSSMIITLGLAVAAATFAQNTGTASINSVDYGGNQAQSGNAAPNSYEAQIPQVRTVPMTSVPPNVQAELEERTDEFHSKKTKAIVFGTIGTVLVVAGYVMVEVAAADATTTTTSNGYYTNSSTSSSRSSNDDQLLLDGLIVFVAGIPFQVIGVVNTVQAIVKGSQLRRYEEEVGYRLSVKPILNPRTGQAGMVASLHF